MADQEPSEIAQPSEGSLHFPALLIARSGLHGAPLLRALAFAPLVGRNSRLDTPASQPVPKALAVVSLVGHQLLWPLPWSPSPSTRDPDRLERRHGQLNLVAVGLPNWRPMGRPSPSVTSITLVPFP